MTPSVLVKFSSFDKFRHADQSLLHIDERAPDRPAAVLERDLSAMLTALATSSVCAKCRILELGDVAGTGRPCRNHLVWFFLPAAPSSGS